MAKNEINFTVRNIESTNEAGTYYDSSKNASGLYMRIRNTGGAKSFKTSGRVNGQLVEVTLGTFPKTTITQARDKAREAQTDFANNISPNDKKKFKRTKQATLAEYFETYLTTRKLQPKTVSGYRTSFKNVLAPLAKKQITDITFNDVLKVHEKYAKQSTAEADRAMRLLRAIFYLAMDEIKDLEGRPLILENPVKKLGKNKHFTRLDRKTRKLEDDQIKPFIEFMEMMAGDKRPFYQTGADLALVLLYHGTRFTEMASIKWEQVDFKYKRLYLSETKNGRRLWLPMTTESEKVFKRRKRLSTGSEYLFPSATVQSKHIADIKKPLKALLEETGIEITPHDLRRTFLSMGARLGFNSYLLKQLANHSPSIDVTAGYVTQSADELREPSQKITKRFLELAGREVNDTGTKINQILDDMTDTEKERLLIRLMNSKQA